MKTTFFHGMLAGILAGIASVVYSQVYCQALLLNFSKVVNASGMIGASIFGCVLASLGYHFFSKFVRRNVNTWFNIIFLILTFASCIGIFSAELPMDIESPEMFIGLTMPMHLFPFMFWLAVKPLFEKRPA